MTETLDIRTIVPYINWVYFFSAWKLAGSYPDIDKVCECPACQTKWLMQFDVGQRPKAQEAMRLMRDAQQWLRSAHEQVEIRAAHVVYPARSVDCGIEIASNPSMFLPTLRQQTPNAEGYCLSLSDFVSPISDRVGFFAVSVRSVAVSSDDVYHSMLAQTLCDRLVEAASEYLHQTLHGAIGIRPAVGYPSLPDQSLIFDFAQLLPLHELGITLTENGAMLPHASVCGMYIFHPQSRYFMVGPISQEQFDQYAHLRGKTPDEMRKFLAHNS